MAGDIQIDLRGASEAVLIVNRLERPSSQPLGPRWPKRCDLVFAPALSRTPGSSKFVLGNPKGWLGSAYHQVLENIAYAHPKNQTIDATVERLWNEAIEAQHTRMLTYHLDRRFDSPTSWPGYHLAKASAALRARSLVSESVPSPPDEDARASNELRGGLRERKFTAYGGKLIGRPDIVRANEIVDFKSGSIVETRDEHGTESIKAAYVRQLQIYGYLIHETLGRWLQRGVLLPAVGPGVEIQLHQQDCEREALEAVGLLEAYNDKVADNVPVTDFAAPSPVNCKWCPYKVLCRPFWTTASTDWSGLLDGAAIEGTLTESPRQIHGGAARALSIGVHAGSEPPREINVTPVNRAVHDVVDTLCVGDVVRIVGLRVRPDGVYVPQI